MQDRCRDCGRWVIVLAAVLLAEIVCTMWDFSIEIAVRKPLGDAYGGERVTRAIMGIVCGGMLAFLIPILWSWRLLAVAPCHLPDT